jgi:hypothetical protein
MKLLRAFMLFFTVILFVSCGNQTTPCGTFTFTGTGNSAISGANIQVNFNFNPGACSKNCNCNTICYVQIVRIIDRETGNFLAPNSDQQNRIVTGRAAATLNGWAIDRISDRNWGYYARNNDGSFANYLTTGSNTTAAILGDTPSGWPENSWFDAVSVPVCIAPQATCVNNLMGYYYWLFIVNPGPSVADPFHEIGVDWNRDSFDQSVIEWNADAAGLGKHNFPAFVRM